MSYILVIDDDPDFRDVMREALAPHRVETTGSPERALGLLSFGELPDVILLDLHTYGEWDGFRFVAEVRRLSALAEIPIVLVSGDTRLANVARAIGAVAYIEKPFRRDELLGCVASVLDSAACPA